MRDRGLIKNPIEEYEDEITTFEEKNPQFWNGLTQEEQKQFRYVFLE